MALKAAIFDCDGTILDSMPMWASSCVGLLERYGVEDAREVFLRYESLDMDKKCDVYHEVCGIGTSGEALYRELWVSVEEAYRTSVKPYPGVRAFLGELARQGVRCVVASSTPPELLGLALAAHGLRDYFDDLIFCGDVGRGKEHPDVYLAAQGRLGTDRRDTWVFEDAPFGIRSAARVGFPVVGILNDHDGRDESFVSRWATVVARDYGELSPERLAGIGPRELHALVVAGSPQTSSPGLVAALAARATLVLAADRGADTCRQAHVVPDVFCGDLDTVSAATLDWVRESDATRHEFDPDKYDTDLSLALSIADDLAEERGCCLRVTLTCCSGGRADHSLAVWGVLARHAQAAPVVVEDGYECRILARQGCPTWRFDGEKPRCVSVVALLAPAVVSESGMRWNLDHAPLETLSDLGISNRAVESGACVTCHDGVVAVFRVK